MDFITDFSQTDIPKDHHKHKCSYCGCVWAHPDDCVDDRGAHHCPRCFRLLDGRWVKYFGGEPVTKLAKVPFAGPDYTFYTK